VKLNNCTLAYIAGFLDGDGCISILKKGDTYIGQVNFIQKDPMILLKIKKLFPGYLQYRKNGKNIYGKDKYIYSLSYCYKKAYDLINLLYPYLIIKKKHAKILLKFRETLNKTNTRNGLTTKVIKQRKKYKKIMKGLNK
jgi:hypothetical protein